MSDNWHVRSEWLGGMAWSISSPEQAAAERAALGIACCTGARYVSVTGPGAVVTLEWDRYTNVARRYGQYRRPCRERTSEA